MYKALISPVHMIRKNLSNYAKYFDESKYFVTSGHYSISELSMLANPTNDKSKRLILSSNDIKVLVHVSNNFFTFLFQEFASIALFYSKIINRNIKLYIYLGSSKHPNFDSSLAKFLFNYLDNINVNYEVITSAEFEEIEINKFYFLQSGFSGFTTNVLYSKTKKLVSNKDTIPFRKVFVGRKDFLQQRIDDSKEIEDFFIKQGFEVVYPEDFINFIDQINYFSECKVLAGISGSALSNLVFMKSGGVVIELSSLFEISNPETPIEIHDFYRIASMYRGHLYFSVSNVSAKAKDLMSNHEAKKFIEML